MDKCFAEQIGYTTIIVLLAFSAKVHASALLMSDISLSLNSQILEDSNIYRDQTNTSDRIRQYGGALSLSISPGRQRIEVGYDGEKNMYETTLIENYENHSVKANLEVNIGDAFSFEGRTAYTSSHDERGTPGVPSLLPISTSLLNQSAKADAFLNLGSEQAMFRYVLESNASAKRFADSALVFLNSDSLNTKFSSLYKYSGKTRVALDLHRNDVLNSSLSTHNIFYTVATGLEWKSTGKIKNHLKIGLNMDPYTAADVFRYTLFMDADITWKRKSYSAFNFTINRRLLESTEAAYTQMASTAVGVGINHRLRRYLQFETNFQATYNQFSKTKGSLFFSGYLGINLSILRRFSLSIGSNRSYMTATNGSPGYSQQAILARLSFVLF
ncbi:MAG: outer membrane beta-barrel protein [Gammaproteobacteria bacterium]|nr:outer membrane beta-barrel protein [Gammaproteobacteria bacterium]